MILAGIAFSVLSSFALGTSDLAAGLLARRIGLLRVVAGGLLLSLLILATVLVLTGRSLPTDPDWVPWIVGVGLLRAFGYFALVRAFSLGPVAVVAPITASSSAVTVLASVVLLGEQPTVVQWIAVVLASAGTILVAVSFNELGRRVSLVGQGPLFAALAMLALSTVVAAQQPPIRAVGWLETITLRRSVEVGVTWLALLLAFRFAPQLLGRARRHATAEVAIAEAGAASDAGAAAPDARVARLSGRGLFGLMALVGILDSVGLSSLALALSVAPAWLFGIVSATNPIVGITYGMVFLGERLRPIQWAGIALIVVGLVLVALG